MLIECSKIKSNQNRIIEEENDVVGNKFAMGKAAVLKLLVIWVVIVGDYATQRDKS